MSRQLQPGRAGAILLAIVAGALSVGSTPLDDYVNAADSNYKYEEVAPPFKGEGYTTHYLNMTSQRWLSDELVSPSIWWHWLAVTIPDNLTDPEHAFLYITGGSNHDLSPPDPTSSDIFFSSTIALTTGCISASLFQIPNQPTLFSEDPLQKHRDEDAVIAYTWYHFQKHPDKPEYLLRLPMTKAAVRAMDTVAAFGKEKRNMTVASKFVVAGASKRGWATWTTAAVDKRVVGAIPLVMDLLNANKVLHHMYRSLGGWTFAFDDYLALNITQNLDTPETQQMFDIVDPYSYIDRLTMPKFLICTGGDEFFEPDDTHYYWKDLKGETYTRIFANAEHSMAGHFISVMFAARAFILSIFHNTPRPKMDWTLAGDENNASITATVDTKPLTAEVWHATSLSTERRDFRLLIGIPNPSSPLPQPVLWSHYDIKPNANGEYVATMEAPKGGQWTAFFIQFTFPGPKESVFEFSTQAQIVPTTFPYAECHGESCAGHLV
ncbi:autocrine proliferation repressor protein A-like [Sycon ciliatum]|uniref:autocrine proliferation repressor protein A-like n=1 Tax=Sycon ciliatum TaxID=27933 RepID=UPI0031F6CA83